MQSYSSHTHGLGFRRVRVGVGKKARATAPLILNCQVSGGVEELNIMVHKFFNSFCNL